MIDESLVWTFASQGAVPVRGLIDDAWLKLLGEAVSGMLEPADNVNEQTNGGTETGTLSTSGMWRDSEKFARFLFHSPVGAIAAAFMRSSVARLYEDLLIYKEVGGDGTTAWHRDSPHWPVIGSQLCSVWLSLESVARGSGEMRFVAGSHLDGDDLVNERAIVVSEAELEQRRVIAIQADPGDVVVFHPRVLHMVSSSVADHPRRTFTIRFAGDDVRWRPRRAMYHRWMEHCGLQKGDILNHPWFPVVAEPVDRSLQDSDL